jgi:hypothetical protein
VLSFVIICRLPAFRERARALSKTAAEAVLSQPATGRVDRAQWPDFSHPCDKKLFKSKKIGVQNRGLKSKYQIGVPNRGPKSGSQIGVPYQGPKSGSRIRVQNRGTKWGCPKSRFPIFFCEMLTSLQYKCVN